MTRKNSVGFIKQHLLNYSLKYTKLYKDLLLIGFKHKVTYSQMFSFTVVSQVVTIC